VVTNILDECIASIFIIEVSDDEEASYLYRKTMATKTYNRNVVKHNIPHNHNKYSADLFKLSVVLPCLVLDFYS
jgi:hypothetical protein